ncbi:MAG: hypothetical protein ACOX2K_10300 [Bacillota bacterium]|jgi:hypothetical protein
MRLSTSVLRVTLFLLVLLIAVPAPAKADVGPKPQLTIVVQNAPEGVYYLDLLVAKHDRESPGWHDLSQYNPGKLALLEGYQLDGWVPGLVHGTRVPMFGNLVGEPAGDTMRHVFSYLGVPKDFKLILVTPDNQLIVSQEVHRRAFQETITYDYATNAVYQQSIALIYLKQFTSTVIPTLLIEGLILLLFGFSLKRSWKPFLAVNIATQVFLTATLGTTLIKGGSLAAALMLLPVEAAILVVEAIAYSFLLTEHSRKRRIWYTVLANIFSAAVGIVLLLQGM